MNKEFINNEPLGIFIIILFFLFYFFIIFEEFIKVKKSTSAILFSGIIWFFLVFFSKNNSENNILNYYIKHVLLEYCELFLFLFVAMVYINSIKSFGIFKLIKFKILSNKISYKKIYWITGFFSFFISPIADNLTTSLVMCSIILSIDKNNSSFVNLNFINIVVASNAGGVFSPFGDITTLMIWQNGIIKFHWFLYTFFSSFLSFFIPSLIISFNIPSGSPSGNFTQNNILKSGFFLIVFIFLFTLFLTVLIHAYFGLPSVLGMMFGFGVLSLFEFFCKRRKILFNLNTQIKKVDWDTLFFFYGVMMCINALSSLGLLDNLSFLIYERLFNDVAIIHKHTLANLIVGIISSVIDNIPITFAILNMCPNMDNGQWLLVTFTIGVGGSLLSFGSASGVALMGKSKHYTFFSHLKWSWCILLGYFLGALFQVYINKFLFFF